MKRNLIVALLAAGCGSDTVDAEGTYSVGVTNRENPCNFDNWDVNAMASGVQVVITQNGENVLAEVEGFGGFGLNVLLGSATFSGSVDGNELDMMIEGTRAQTTGNCTYSYNAHLTATLVGDALNGSIAYSPQHNGNSDCAAIECVNRQDFAGSRPPR